MGSGAASGGAPRPVSNMQDIAPIPRARYQLDTPGYLGNTQRVWRRFRKTELDLDRGYTKDTRYLGDTPDPDPTLFFKTAADPPGYYRDITGCRKHTFFGGVGRIPH